MAEQVTREFSIVGSSFVQGAWGMIQKLPQGEPLRIVREPANKYDPNAVMVCIGTQHVGYVPRGLAATIAPLMDAGIEVICRKDVSYRAGVCELAYVPPDEA